MPDEGPMKFSLAMISSCDAQSESFQDHQVWTWIVHRDAISVDLQVFTKLGFNEDYLSVIMHVFGVNMYGGELKSGARGLLTQEEHNNDSPESVASCRLALLQFTDLNGFLFFRLLMLNTLAGDSDL